MEAAAGKTHPQGYHDGMARFVVLEHDWPHLHWDLFLETGAVLTGWRLARPPEGGGPIPAERTADHRLAYLDYEGPVSGGRGRVQRWDAGTYAAATADAAWTIDFQGVRLRGRFVLRRIEGATWVFAGETTEGKSTFADASG